MSKFHELGFECLRGPKHHAGVSAEEGEPVILNVYDLGKGWLQMNDVFSEVLQIGGGFHTGVVFWLPVDLCLEGQATRRPPIM